VKPTRGWDLVAAALLFGGAAYALTRLFYDRVPEFPRTAPLSLLVVGLVEAQTAVITRRRLLGRPGTKPIPPLTVARLVALAKASSVAGAALAGAWSGVLGYAAPRADQIGAAGADAITAGLGLGGALVLVGAALALERVCRIRDR
jgi:Protein of unknown function (DUF3180)